MLSPVRPLPICLDSGTQHFKFYALLFFTASDLASITGRIHNGLLFLLWLCLFFLSGAISPPFFSSHCFPIYLAWSDGTRCHDFCFLMLSFKPAFSLSSFTFIKRFFSSSSISAIGWCHLHIWGYWYFSKQSWFQLVLPPAQCFSWCTLYRNKQDDNIQPWHTPFPIWDQSVVPCPVLTVASWPAYRFLKRQVKWSGVPISFRIFHSLLWSTQSKA